MKRGPSMQVNATVVHVIGGTMCLAIAAGALSIGLVPTMRSRTAERTELARLEQVRADRTRVAEEFASLREALEGIKAENASRWVDLVGEKQLNARMADITKLLTDRGFDIQALQPGEKATGAVVSHIPIRLDVLGDLDSATALLETLDTDYPDLHCETINLEHTGPGTVRLRLALRWLLAPADMPKEKPAG